MMRSLFRPTMWAGLLLVIVGVSFYATKGLLIASPPAKASSDTAVAAAKASDAPAAQVAGIPAGHNYLYKLARVVAAGELAKKQNISRKAAREKIDDALTDAQLHDLVTSAPTPVTVKAQPVGGRLTDFLEWLASHQEVIMAIVAIIMSLFQTAADVDNSSIFLPHDWCAQLFAMAA